MSEIVIRVENLSKCYRIQHRNGRSSGGGLRHAIHDAVTAPFRRIKSKLGNRNSKPPESVFRTPNSDLQSPPPASEDFWALRDVSFEVKRGDILGIIGRNGAGKSTLLKILSRITEPTNGRIGVKGRVASLLEVGTGFHPELTGRENIYLNGAILGMTRSEVRCKFDEMVNFAGVEKFLDTPVKHYSSGMYVRLAFAIAAHLDPEILIVDEVLAVGDAEFQKRCLGKMGEISQREGRTVLFVSHNMGAIQSLCRSGIVLSSGRMVQFGEISSVISEYTSETDGASGCRHSTIPLSPGVVLKQIAIFGKPIHSMDKVKIELHFEIKKRVLVHKLIPIIYNHHGHRVAILDLFEKKIRDFIWTSGCTSIILEVQTLPLVEGIYEIGLHLDTDSGSGDFLNLRTLLIAPPRNLILYDRIPAIHRGDLELAFTNQTQN